MITRASLVTATVLSVAAAAVWSWTANLTIGPADPLHFTRSPTADYAALAAAPTGSAWGLFALVAAVYALCFLAAGLRARRKALREAAIDLHLDDEYAEAVPVPVGRRY